MKYQTDVCIVGCGPAGALLGYLLAKEGISVTVLERSAGTKRGFRGEHINSETETLMKEYKLFEKIEKLGLLKMKKVEFFSGKQIVKTIFPSFPEDHVGIHIPQSHLLNAIIQESQKYKGYHLHLNTTVIKLIEDENGFYTGVKAKKGGEEFIVDCSIVIGADGRFSTIRKLANIPVSIMKHGYDVLWAKVPAPIGWESTIRMLQIHGQQLALFTQTGGFIQIGWNIDEDSFPSLKRGSFKPFLKTLLESSPQLKGEVLEHLNSWKDLVCLKVNSSRCETWVKNGLVIIGDAAHTMTPTGAIGINCAMKDAQVLAPILINCLLEKDVSKNNLRKFEISRRAEIDNLQTWQIEEESSYSDNFS
jgi:2-polyprenyl-6-methoxyphenol hydroxylase-like FAD-dependent oxidoreductase